VEKRARRCASVGEAPGREHFLKSERYSLNQTFIENGFCARDCSGKPAARWRAKTWSTAKIQRIFERGGAKGISPAAKRGRPKTNDRQCVADEGMRKQQNL